MSENKTIFNFDIGENRDVLKVQRANQKFASKNLTPGKLFCTVDELFPSIYDFKTLNKILNEYEKNPSNREPIDLLKEIWTSDQLNKENKNNQDDKGWVLLLDANPKIYWLEKLSADGQASPSKWNFFRTISKHVAGVRFFVVLTSSCKKAYLSYTTYTNRYLYEELKFK